MKKKSFIKVKNCWKKEFMYVVLLIYNCAMKKEVKSAKEVLKNEKFDFHEVWPSVLLYIYSGEFKDEWERRALWN